ncbi:hypothetical protein Tco_0609117, partial [Tanacetum coccineum]
LRIVAEGIVQYRIAGLEPVRSHMKFCSGLEVYHLPPASSVASEQDKLPSSVRLDSRARSYGGLFSVSVTKLATGRLIDGSSCDEIDMVIKNLDLELKIDVMMRDFLYPSWWKELSKEMSSKILPCGDGSCWKTFKPVASLIAKGKLK